MTDRRSSSALTVFLGLIALFVLIVAVNAAQATSAPVTLSALPNNPKPGYPVQITAVVTNTQSSPHWMNASIYMDGRMVLASSLFLLPGESQTLTYTTGAPPQGESLRASAFVEGAGAGSSTYLLVPASAPEAWMSFMAFSTFAISLVSSTTTTLMSTFTLTYYSNTMNLAASGPASAGPYEVGIFLSVLLIGLLVFVELTDKAYGKVSPRLTALRGRYGLLAANLLLVFAGIVVTKVILLIHG